MSMLTIRTDAALESSLRKRAKAEGLSVSELVRTILRDALAAKSFGARAGDLAGSLDLRAGRGDAWRAELRRRNWRS